MDTLYDITNSFHRRRRKNKIGELVFEKDRMCKCNERRVYFLVKWLNCNRQLERN